MKPPEFEDDLERGYNYFGVLRVSANATEFEIVAAVRDRLKEARMFGAVSPEELSLLDRARRTLTGPDRSAYEIAASRVVRPPLIGPDAVHDENGPKTMAEFSPRYRAAVEQTDAKARALMIEMLTNSGYAVGGRGNDYGEDAKDHPRSLIETAEDRAEEPQVAAWLEQERGLAAAAKMPLNLWLESWWRLDRMLEDEGRLLEPAAQDVIARTRQTLTELLGRTDFPAASEDTGAAPSPESKPGKPRGGDVRSFKP